MFSFAGYCYFASCSFMSISRMQNSQSASYPPKRATLKSPPFHKFGVSCYFRPSRADDESGVPF